MGFVVNNTTFPGLLDLLFPCSCRGCDKLGAPLCSRCKNNIIIETAPRCPNCKSLNIKGKCQKCNALPPTFVVGERTGLIGRLVYDLKFNSVRALAKPIAEILDATLPSFVDKVIIVPLPTIRRHIRQRGLDHTLLIAKKLASIRGANYRVEQILRRASNTVQVGSDRKTRLRQANSAFKVDETIPIDRDAVYIVFDDIWTTGASIKTAVRLLKSAGAKKVAVSLLAVSRIDQK